MASHRSTPKTVLNAPTRTVTVLSRQDGYNRATRRRAYRTREVETKIVDGRKVRTLGKVIVALRSKGTIPLDAQFPRTNRPYVKPVEGARRSVSARVASVAGRVRSTVASARRADA